MRHDPLFLIPSNRSWDHHDTNIIHPSLFSASFCVTASSFSPPLSRLLALHGRRSGHRLLHEQSQPRASGSCYPTNSLYRR
jgi:hypothetical protein